MTYSRPAIFIVPIEPLETRYTSQWYDFLPKAIENITGNDVDVFQIKVPKVSSETTDGAFLNFAHTNIWKSSQLRKISQYISKGYIKSGDYILFTDAWNPSVLSVKYMTSLLGIDVKIGGMWHAGSYDPHDFLGRIIGMVDWVSNTERAMFNAYDHNFFATQFHIDMFTKNLLVDPKDSELSKIFRVGWPMEYLESEIKNHKVEKTSSRKTVLFPHRISEEKNIELFREIASILEHKYNFVVAQDKPLAKNEYHKLLWESDCIFSANLQETLGISWYEGLIAGSVPFLPDHLSYSEMADEHFLYDPKIMDCPENMADVLDDFLKQDWTKNGLLDKANVMKTQCSEKYFDGSEMYDIIIGNAS